MTIKEFFAHLKSMRGEFVVLANGYIRHKTLPSIEDYEDDGETPIMGCACLVESVRHKLGIAPGTPLNNAAAETHAKMLLKLPRWKIEDLINVSDGAAIYPYERLLHQRMLRTLGLSA